VNVKMIFMLFSTSYSLFQEKTRIFEHHAHETRPGTCDLVVLKLYKTQTNSKNHESCRDVMISYVVSDKNMKVFHEICHTLCVETWPAFT
jgi:hypothetical protein